MVKSLILENMFIDCLFEFLINDSSTVVGHFVSSPRERKKRHRGVSRREKERRMRKQVNDCRN